MSEMTELIERRKEVRHIVVGIEAHIDGAIWPIVDISRSGVRLLKPLGYDRGAGVVEIEFVLLARRHRTVTVTGHWLRDSRFDIVFRYTPPTSCWERTLRSLDSFAQTALSLEFC